jgi:hypothetical protein
VKGAADDVLRLLGLEALRDHALAAAEVGGDEGREVGKRGQRQKANAPGNGVTGGRLLLTGLDALGIGKGRLGGLRIWRSRLRGSQGESSQEPGDGRAVHLDPRIFG